MLFLKRWRRNLAVSTDNSFFRELLEVLPVDIFSARKNISIIVLTGDNVVAS